MSALLEAAELRALEARIDAALQNAREEVEAVAAVERGDIDQPFWYVRLDGDAKSHFSAEFTLGQRTLVVESYFMPAPEENQEALYLHLLRRNRTMQGLGFVIGAESAVYLRGQIENRHVDDDAVDHLLAAVYEYTEQFFAPAMRIGYASRYQPSTT